MDRRQFHEFAACMAVAPLATLATPAPTPTIEPDQPSRKPFTKLVAAEPVLHKTEGPFAWQGWQAKLTWQVKLTLSDGQEQVTVQMGLNEALDERRVNLSCFDHCGRLFYWEDRTTQPLATAAQPLTLGTPAWERAVVNKLMLIG